MKKRAIALLLAAAMGLMLCGCSALFKKEYLSVSKYEGDTKSKLGADAIEVKNYDELLKTIVNMVNAHEIEGRIAFAAYEGNLQRDLDQACWELEKKTAIGSFAVEYMSYDLNRIVTYYEAVIYITYKHSRAEVESIEYVSGKSDLKNKLNDELYEFNRRAFFRLVSSTISAEEVLGYVETAYALNPASCVLMPKATVQIHPDSGSQRIVEIDFEYSADTRLLKSMRVELLDEIDRIYEETKNDNPTELAKALYNTLAGRCIYDPLGELRAEQGLEPSYADSAYGALVEKYADSRGIALAFSALCNKAGIECIVVDGSVEKKSHSWNIVKIDDRYYHIDVSADKTWGFGNSFMKTDRQMQSRYWWNIESYPECSDDATQTGPTPQI